MWSARPNRPLPELCGVWPVISALFDLNGLPHYVHSGWFLISDANLAVIVLMIAVFCLALVLPFPRDKERP